MRIYNGKAASVEMPLFGDDVRVVAPGHGLSRDFMPNDTFLHLVAQSYEEDELALIVSGPFEINMMAKFPSLAPMVVQSIDEAIKRFAPKEEEIVVAEETQKEPEAVGEGEDFVVAEDEETQKEPVAVKKKAAFKRK